MTSFKNYLLHRIKATWVLTVVLCLFAVIITGTTVKAYHYSYYEQVFDEATGMPTGEEVLSEGVRVRNLGVVFVILGGLCTVIPVLELGGLKNKRNADTMYSLPIDRRKMGVTHFTNGYLQILAVYLSSAVTTAFLIISGGLGYLYLQYLAPLLLLPIPAALLLYAYFCYLFNEANSTVDGCLFIASGTLMPYILCLALGSYTFYIDEKYVNTIFDRIDGSHMFPYFPIIEIADIFGDGLNHKNISFSYDELDIAMIVVWAIIGLLSAIGFYFSFSRKRTETIGDLSTSWVGYKTIIPLAMFCITAAIGHSGDFYIVIIGAVAAVIGYMLYRRSFKIKAVDFVSIAVGFGSAIVLRILESLVTRGGSI